MNAEDKAEKEGLARWVCATMMGELMRNYPADSKYDHACLALVDEVCADVVELVRAALRLRGELNLDALVRTFALDAWAERQAVFQPVPTAAQQLLINLEGELVDFAHPDYRQHAADAAIRLALGYAPARFTLTGSEFSVPGGLLVCGESVRDGWQVQDVCSRVVVWPARDLHFAVAELISHLADVAANGQDYAAFGYVGGE